MKVSKTRPGSNVPWVFPQVVLLFFCFSIVPPLALGGSPNPEKGKESYETYCVNCHGIHGKGDGPAAKVLTPPPANFTSKKTKSKPDKELLTTIRNGKPKTAMPPWKEKLSNQQIHDTLAYIRSLGK